MDVSCSPGILFEDWDEGDRLSRRNPSLCPGRPLSKTFPSAALVPEVEDPFPQSCQLNSCLWAMRRLVFSRPMKAFFSSNSSLNEDISASFNFNSSASL